MTNSKDYNTFLRLSARLTDKQRESIDPIGVGVTFAERCAIIATILGAKDPYAVVLYPEYMDDILNNRQPEWMEGILPAPELITD